MSIAFGQVAGEDKWQIIILLWWLCYLWFPTFELTNISKKNCSYHTVSNTFILAQDSSNNLDIPSINSAMAQTHASGKITARNQDQDATSPQALTDIQSNPLSAAKQLTTKPRPKPKMKQTDTSLPYSSTLHSPTYSTRLQRTPWSLAESGRLQHVSHKLTNLWQNVTKCHILDSTRLRWTPSEFGGVWWNPVESGGLQWTPADSGRFWWSLVNSGGVWWIPVESGGVQWSLAEFCR